MDNSYTQIKLIECNRASSIEAKANKNDNPALFTNEISEGFTLQPLDRISVHSSYVSEVGAEGDKLEIKGNFIKSYTFENITVIKPLTKEYVEDETLKVATAKYYPDNISFIDGRTAVNASKTVNIYDNQIKIPIQYYKNNNGENHVYLPRNYNYKFTSDVDFRNNWTHNDDRTTGMAKSGPEPNYILLDDYRYDGTNYKLRTNNKRFTAFIRTETTYNASFFEEYNSNIYVNPDPAGDEYILYQELLELEAPTGFNSPEKIAEVLTEQLKQTEEPQTLELDDSVIAGRKLNVLSLFNARTFKTFTASNYDGWTEAVFNTFNSSSIPGYTQSTLDHYNAYEFVFHKRPEIQIAGRNLNTVYGLQLGQETDPADDNKRHIYLELLFNDENCKRILDLFDAEALYPEIWTNDNIKNHINEFATIDNSRFLHINKNVNASQTDLFGRGMLGNDGYTAFPAGLNLASLPLFVYYKDNERNVTCAEATATNTSYDVNTTTYAYGFAIPYIKDGESQVRIALNARNVGPNIGHHYLNGGIIEGDRKIGFDHHFNAYSTAALILTSGVSFYEFDTPISTAIVNHTVPISKYFTGAYIGATNPKIEYDFNKNQFSILNLHSAENVGQTSFIAGDTVSGSPETTSNPATEVFRINKNLNFSLFTPDAKPYAELTGASWSGHKRDIGQKNDSIDAWTIFDSRSGIYLSKDIGFSDEEEFDKSLFKSLGFNYNQWQRPDKIDNTNNRQVRIDNNTYNNLDLITTNASIVSDISTTFDINFFGATFFNHIIAHSRVVEDKPFYPLIINDAVSYGFKADFLARRMLKPYYTIRSSLIDDNVQYIGNSKNSKAKMPIIAVVNKINGEGDFYFGEASDFEFVVTQEKTITSIQTALLDPDASYIKCNNDSAVIYKIQRKITNNFSIAEQILLNQAKKKTN